MAKACFTGHRAKSLVGYNKANYTPFVNELSEWLHHYTLTHDIDTFISGGAQGFDQLAFWAVNKLQRNHPELSIKNIVYVPFHGQESKWKETGCFSQHEYSLMLRCANEVHYCSDKTCKEPFHTLVKLLDDRNKAMVNDSHRVIALYSLLENRNGMSSGGTANCIRYAATKNVPVDRCVYHLTGSIMHITSLPVTG